MNSINQTVLSPFDLSSRSLSDAKRVEKRSSAPNSPNYKNERNNDSFYHKVFSIFKILQIRMLNFLNRTVFNGTPQNYPFAKKLEIFKRNSFTAGIWDFIMVIGSILLCANYISETYTSTYENQRFYKACENFVTPLIVLDFTVSWIISKDNYLFLASYTFWVDITTIIPVFVRNWIDYQGRTDLRILKFPTILRIFGVLRILRSFKKTFGLNDLTNQIVKVCLTMLSLIFVSAAVIEILESDLKQLIFYDCQYSNAATDWEPSCWKSKPGNNHDNSTTFSLSLIHISEPTRPY